MFENTDVCANCECLLEDDCCGGGAPFVLDEISYCCQECAEDGECTCGCIANPVAAPTEGQSAPVPGPTL